MECCKSSSKKEVYSINAYIKKKERPQVNDLTLHIKELQKEKTQKKTKKTETKISRRNE